MSTAPATDRLTDALRARGLRVTSQRVVLLEALHALGRHATAEELARAAGERLPGLALPTVYAALELFEELGLVRRVQAGGAVLFDPVADGHAHLACRRCGGGRRRRRGRRHRRRDARRAPRRARGSTPARSCCAGCALRCAARAPRA